MTTSTSLPADKARGSLLQRQQSLKDLLSGTGGAFLGLVLLFLALSIASPYFLTPNNILNIVDQVTVLGIIAVGATAVIITGGIDLSVGSTLALSTMVLGFLSRDGVAPMWVAILAAIAVGGLTGLVNGLGVTVGKLPPFIATLAVMSIARGLANLITNGQQIVGYPVWFYELSSKRYLGVFSVSTVLLIIIVIAGWMILKYLAAGRSLYAIGGGAEVARLAGISVKRITAGAYVATGLLAGVASLVLASRLDSSQPSAGTGLELDVIAAIVIGGASLAGGTGTMVGTVIGVLIMGVLRNGLNLLGVSPFLQAIFIGIVIAVAVLLDVLRHRERS